MDPAHFATHARLETRHWWFVARRRILLDLIAQAVPPGSGIVDLGCGTGTLDAVLVERGHRVVGLDPSPDALDLAQAAHPTVRFRVAADPGDAADDLAAADLLLLLDVLEHVDDDRGFLERAVAPLRPGARILITVPAKMTLWGPQDDAVGHRRRYESDTLAAVWASLPVRTHWISYFNARLYPPILLVRTLSRVLGVSVGKDNMDFALPPAPLNRALTGIFAGEAGVLRALAEGRRFKGYGAGVSLIGLLEREDGA